METQEIIDKLKRGLNAEYYLAASGSTRTKDNKDLTLTIKEAEHICSLFGVVGSCSDSVHKSLKEDCGIYKCRKCGNEL